MPHPLYPLIFSPFRVKNLVLKNRIVMSPMGTNFAGEYGQITNDHIKYYEQRAKGGPGLITVENSNVDYPLGVNGATQLRIDHDRYIPGLSRLVSAVKKHGCGINIQINHAGAGTSNERTEGHGTVGPSDIPVIQGGEIPRPLSRKEIADIIVKYGQAAQRVQHAGFDAVEVHSAHSYLIAQFMSPLYNRRTDEFGGSVENRAHFCRLILEEVRGKVGSDFPIFLRISADEFITGGRTLEDTLEIIQYFTDYVDVLSISAAVNDSLEFQIEPMSFPEGWRVYLSDAVKKRFDLPTITAGTIRTPAVAEKILSSRSADLVAIGRGLICDPDWTNKVYRGETKKIRKCISCNIGCITNRFHGGKPIRCSLNPDLVHGDEALHRSVSSPTHVVVIGAGPAGLEAACTAAEVGCLTFVFEKEADVGGMINAVRRFPAKEKIRYVRDYYEERMQPRKNLIVLRGKSPSLDDITDLKPDMVVYAAGGRPLLPPIKGLQERADQPDTNVHTVTKLLACLEDFKNTAGKKVVVAGGGAVGLDCAAFFATGGASVLMVEKLPQIGVDLDPVTRKHMLNVLEKRDVRFYTDTEIMEITDGELICTQKESIVTFGFDVAMVCLGFRAEDANFATLKDYFDCRGVEVINIGDSLRPRKLIFGIGEGRNIINSKTLLERLQ